MLGYTSWYQLFVYSCDSCLLSTYLLLFSYPSVVYLLFYLVIFYLQFILLLFCAHCLHTRVLPFTHTLSRSLSNDPEFARPDIGRFVSLVRCSMRPYILWGAWVSLWFWYSHLSYLPVISLFSIYQFHLLFQFFIHMISCVDAIWHCSNHDLLQFRFIACFQVT